MRKKDDAVSLVHKSSVYFVVIFFLPLVLLLGSENFYFRIIVRLIWLTPNVAVYYI